MEAVVLAVLGALPSKVPSWEVGPSVCESVRGFHAADLYPIRSPLAVADFLVARAAGGSMCEIGTRRGDIMSCVHAHNISVTAIEMDRSYCRMLRARGFGAVCKRVEDIAVDKFPMADVYYWWPMSAMDQNERWLRIVARAVAANRRRATVYIGFDAHYREDMENLPRLVRTYGANVTRIHFDEGGLVSGADTKAKFYAAAEEKFEASIARPFYTRPGHWGVFLVAAFSVSPEMWLRMRGPAKGRRAHRDHRAGGLASALKRQGDGFSLEGRHSYHAGPQTT
uniref:Methyltransferase domain-containing protein n=1 Tax=Calcidiscus leptoporus TaxID=127549 RepID=A0A6U5NIA9_9EUKA|mmetsp:Transcript_6722/g.15602  ORF Transcript_6722/g.15602 Transcript_6722/m.15602 type:complete len:282 (+) Transcript_6722:233-1078(+)